jgi:hypothetical protein
VTWIKPAALPQAHDFRENGQIAKIPVNFRFYDLEMNMSKHEGTARHPRRLLVADGAEGAVGNNALQAEPARGPVAASDEGERPDAIPDGEIAPVAYGLWLDRGQRHGADRDDWFEAERRLREERTPRPHSTHSFVAEQAREALESRRAREARAGNRERMIDIGRGNQQAGRQRS